MMIRYQTALNISEHWFPSLFYPSYRWLLSMTACAVLLIYVVFILFFSAEFLIKAYSATVIFNGAALI